MIAFIGTGDNKHAPGTEPLQKFFPGIHGVNLVFGQGKAPCNRGSPGIDERNLNQIERLTALIEPAARLGMDQMYVRALGEVSRKIGKRAFQRFENGRVKFYARYAANAEIQPRQKVATSTHANHGNRFHRTKMISDIDDIIAQKSQRFYVAIKTGEDGGSIDINVKVTLINLITRLFMAVSPSKRFSTWVRNDPHA